MVQAVLFDADGVLVDACELHYVALNRALATMGWNISREEHENIYNGLPTAKKLQMLSDTKSFPSDWHKAVHDLKQEFTIAAIDECLTPDLSKRELIADLKSQGILVGVCSNSLRKTLRKMLVSIGVNDLVDLAIGNDDVVNPKPAPDMYLQAAALLDVPIGRCLIVEDSEVGLQAAYAAQPLEVIEVSGPAEVNLSLLKRFERHLGVVKEAA